MFMKLVIFRVRVEAGRGGRGEEKDGKLNFEDREA